MGQYFVIVNLDKMELIEPAKVDQRIKMWDLCTSLNTPRLLTFLLVDTYVDYRWRGRWAGDRISIKGDYSDWYDIKRKHTECEDITEEVLKAYNEFAETDVIDKYSERRDKYKISPEKEKDTVKPSAKWILKE